MKRKLLSALLAGALCLSLFALPAAAASSAGSTVEETIRALGIMTGDGNGNMNLSAPVTRAEFAKMMTAASVYKDSVGEGSGVSPFKDVKYTHWSAEYIRIAVNAGWVVGYLDGTYRPDNTIVLEEAACALLRLLGYTSADLSGSYPMAQLAKFQALGLGSRISKARGQTLTRGDCMNIFYELMGAESAKGQAYATTLGYSVNAAGEVDYAAVVSAGTEGPFVVTDSGAWTLALPFGTSAVTVYRNGVSSSLADVSIYDVFYYNKNLRTVWAYSKQVVGIYSAAAPNVSSPASVTVAGQSYSLGTSAASYKLSLQGPFSIGDTVTLLLGMNGDVVDVVAASELAAAAYGVVKSSAEETYIDAAGTVHAVTMVTIVCTDGVTRKVAGSGSSYSAGDLVCAEYAGGKYVARRVSDRPLSGRFSADGRTFAGYTLADGAELLDTTKKGAALVTYPSRLAGAALSSSDVRCYTLDSAGHISSLILNDATGDMASYGILTDVSETTIPGQSVGGSWTGGGITGVYRYVIGGQPGSFQTSSTLFNVGEGPALFTFDGGSIDRIRNLTSVKLGSIAGGTARDASGASRPLADGVQVYVKLNNEYYLSSLSVVNTSSYALTGAYDAGYAAGGHIRVIIAVEK